MSDNENKGGNSNGYPQGQGMPGNNQMNGNGFQGEYNPNGYPQGQGMPGNNQMNGNGFQGEYNYHYQVPIRKSRKWAAFWAIVLGTFGVHKFYMGKPAAVLYIWAYFFSHV